MAINYKGLNLPNKVYQALAGAPESGAQGNALALSQLWLVKISKEDMDSILSIIHQDFSKFEGNKWDFTQDAYKSMLPQYYAGNHYYLLAQGCVFPGDSILASKTGADHTGALKGAIGESRGNLSDVTITFHETNQSIVDLFFRPWALMVGYKSLKHFQLRKEIELVCFQKGGNENTLKIRKRVVLERACPIQVDSEEYNYSGDKVIARQVQFTYNRYHIIANEANDVRGTIGETYARLAKEKGLDKESIFDFLNPYIEWITRANQIYSETRDTIERLEAQTIQVLRSVGLDDQANKLQEEFNRLGKELKPLDEGIGTAGRVGVGVGIADQAITDIAEIAKVLLPTSIDSNPILEFFDEEDVVPIVEDGIEDVGIEVDV